MRIGKKGFTLVEVIVSLAIMTIVAGSVGAFIVAGNNSYLRGNKELTLQEEAQLAANQMIDLIIDVEQDIKFTPDHTGTAVDLDGSTAKDAAGNEITTAHVSELRLVNNENTYMIRWQGTASGDYATANQVYLYEVKNTTDADGNLVVGDLTTATPALMAEHVTSFSVDLSQVKDKRKVILNMIFTYQDRSYDIAETIKLRNDLEKTGTAYAWISALTIDPPSATLPQGKIQQFTYNLSGDAEAVAEGVTWSVSYASGANCKSTINQDGILKVDDEETIGPDVLVVKCTAKADTSMVAYAYVTVEERLIDSLTITPHDGSLIPLESWQNGQEANAVGDGKRINFTCTLDGKDSAKAEGVEWTVERVDGTARATRTVISKTGAMTAYLVADSEEKQGYHVLRVTCSSVADPSMKDEALITVSNVPGKYSAELIAETLTTYKFDEGNQKRIGYCVNIECLPSWADYRNGYPKISWEIVGDSKGYTFGPSGSVYEQILYCSYHENVYEPPVTVRATVQLDATTTVYPTIDIKIPKLKTALAEDKPYINSDQFVLNRNGEIECWLENYDGTGKVTWRFANDAELGLAASREIEDKLDPSKDKEYVNILSQRMVGFSRYKERDKKGSLPDAYEDGTRQVFPNMTYDSKNDHAYIWAKYSLPWNQEYRLTLEAVDEEGNVIAETDILIPECKVLFPSGSRYMTVNQGQAIYPRCKCDACKNDPNHNHWGNETAQNKVTGKWEPSPALYNQWIYVTLYGFYTGNLGLKDSGNWLNLGSKMYGDSKLAGGTGISATTWTADEGVLQISIGAMEQNKDLYLQFYDKDHYNEQDYRLDRVLVIQWNRKDAQ